jgi:hypothetical protein
MDIRIRDVDPTLHRDFKTICSFNGTSMRNQLVALMMQYVAKNADKLQLEGNYQKQK